MKTIGCEEIKAFEEYLVNEEKSRATIEKYVRDITALAAWLDERPLEKRTLLEYKTYISERYKSASVNSMISSINCFLDHIERYDCKVKTVRLQKHIFAAREKELTKAEYERLLDAAKEKHNERLFLLMQTICACGIRVSELSYITVEALKRGSADIRCKGKERRVLLPRMLCKKLSRYASEQKIKSGAVFISKNGRPLDRSNIWTDMKKLCEHAGVSKEKVFPHNLRHLFARTYYSVQKDIVRLADVLGHTSINTTRIYTMETGEEHKRQIERLGLLRC